MRFSPVRVSCECPKLSANAGADLEYPPIEPSLKDGIPNVAAVEAAVQDAILSSFSTLFFRLLIVGLEGMLSGHLAGKYRLAPVSFSCGPSHLARESAVAGR